MKNASLNSRAAAVLKSMRGSFSELSVHAIRCPSGASLYDFGTAHSGTLAAGRLLAKICMANLAEVEFVDSCFPSIPLPVVQTWTDHPIDACIASQYAGWPFEHNGYFAIASGPGRLLRGKEPMLLDLQLKEQSSQAVVVLETNTLPPAEAVASLANDCHIEPSQLSVCVARTSSLPGLTQIVARSIETTMHKMHELKFDLRQVVAGVGWAPLPPLTNDNLAALGWSNDAILYGGKSHLVVDADQGQLDKLAGKLTSDTSPDFGAPFVEIFKRHGRDFYKIDKMLFSPAQVTINNIRTGQTQTHGRVHDEILRRSFGLR